MIFNNLVAKTSYIVKCCTGACFWSLFQVVIWNIQPHAPTCAVLNVLT
nr:MAG TPA: hypothetical protein [Caudoviricetes sp.]